jgi:hypothetical protein
LKTLQGSPNRLCAVIAPLFHPRMHTKKAFFVFGNSMPHTHHLNPIRVTSWRAFWE